MVFFFDTTDILQEKHRINMDWSGALSWNTPNVLLNLTWMKNSKISTILSIFAPKTVCIPRTLQQNFWWNRQKSKTSKFDFWESNGSKHFKNDALEIPWATLSIFATYEHLQTFPEHLRDCTSWSLKRAFLTIFTNYRDTTFIVDASEMLVDASACQEWKMCVKGFQMHQIWP